MFIHRGLLSKNLKENHISAFKECIKNDYNIETDIHFSKNNTAVCFHDYNLKRLLNIKKKIKNIPDQELIRYNITKLKELLNIVKPKTKILIEIKPLLNQITLEEIKKIYLKHSKNIFFISFIEKNLFKLKKSIKDVRLGLIFKNNCKYSDIKKKLNKKYINFLVLPKNFEKINKINKIKKKKFFYTIKNVNFRNIKKNYILENLIV
jgi:glycerophosphoryl diester phosphodiesterase